jgi:hypothetical protein
MWILLVASDARLRNDARRLLFQRGHQVVCASDPARALAQLHLHPFDLIAADVEAARSTWAASLRNRWDTFDVPLAVFRRPGDLLGLQISPAPQEKSARRWPAPPDAQLASRLLSVFHATRRR